MKNLDTDREDYKLVDDVYLNNSDCYYDCNAQLPINENEMNFQYLECVNADFPHISLYSTEKVLSLKQDIMDNGDNNEEKEFHQETCTEGLVLKELPSHLKYAYLELPKSKPVIISARLSDAEEQKLLKILKNYQESIAWSIDELKGINPSICMHKIMLEENAKPYVEHQRRLNPVMKEVVMKEVLKWLNAGFIYAISDSPWVSLVHVVPKKGGFTVIQNEKKRANSNKNGNRMESMYRLPEAEHSNQEGSFPIAFH